MKIKGIAACVLAGAIVSSVASIATAQTWPNRPIRMVVPYPAGGGTDFFARLIGAKLGENLGQSVIVENRPGASSIVGAEIVAKAPADGYTVLIGDNATYAVNPYLFSKLPYDPLKDFEPVTRTIVAALLVGVNAESPVKSVSEFIAAVKARGTQFNYGSPWSGTPHHLAMEAFLQALGLKATHVPYKGGAPAMQDLLAGRLDGAFIDMGTAGANLKAGKLRVLAVGNRSRLQALPDVPTVAESGVAGYEAFAWQGFAFPAGTPKDISARLAAEYRKVVADPQVQQKMTDVGFEATPSTPEEFVALIRSEQARWSKVVREGGIRLD